MVENDLCRPRVKSLRNNWTIDVGSRLHYIMNRNLQIPGIRDDVTQQQNIQIQYDGIKAGD